MIKRYYFAVLLIVASPVGIFGATINLNSSGDFGTASIWSGSTIPGSADDVIIPSAGGPKSLTVSDARTINTLTIEVNSTLTITGSGSLTILGDLVANNNFTIVVSSSVTLIVNGNFVAGNGLALSVSGDVDVAGSFTAGNNTDIDISTGGTLSVDGDFTSGGGTTTVNVDGTLSVDGTIDTSGKDVSGSGSIESTSCGDDMIGSGGIQCSTPLPITLGSFDLSSDGTTALLSWTTFTEENFHYFDVQRAEVNLDFKSIGEVEGNGYSQDLKHYESVDSSPISGTSYYRLKAIDYDGSFEIFRAVPLYIGDGPGITVYPNPFTEKLFLHGDQEMMRSIYITNLLGVTIPFEIINELDKKLILFESLQDGVYFLNFLDKSGQHSSVRLLK